MKTLDCRNLDCPQPVLRTKKALSEHAQDIEEIIVDNETARENVMRFLRSQGHDARWREEEGLFLITLEQQGETVKEVAAAPFATAESNTPVMMISTNELGRGSSELGGLLMRNFIYTITQRDDLPRTVILMNTGVKLSIEDSPVLEELTQLTEKGVEILVCGTCLDYYNLKEKHRVGLVSNMYDIVDALFAAERLVTL